jgi:hypothetical protein
LETVIAPETGACAWPLAIAAGTGSKAILAFWDGFRLQSPDRGRQGRTLRRGGPEDQGSPQPGETMRRHLFRGIVAAGLMAAASAAPQDRALIQADRDRDNWRLHGRTYDN